MNLQKILSTTIISSSLACATINPSYEVIEKRSTEKEVCYTNTGSWFKDGIDIIYESPKKYILDLEGSDTPKYITKEGYNRIEKGDLITKKELKKLVSNITLFSGRIANSEETNKLRNCRNRI